MCNYNRQGLMERYNITPDHVREAQRRIARIAMQTPMIRSFNLSSKWNRNVWLKLENLQPTGAFKIRGAANAILGLSAKERKRGVITVSTGNHGKAVAYVAAQLGVKATVCITELVPQVKVEGIRALGAEVIVAGKDQDEATAEATRLESEKGLRYISPFDDQDVIAGQGTVALEIMDLHPEIDTMVIPLSGGGLMGGMALAAKAIKPNIRLIGVTNDNQPAMYTSLNAGHVVPVGESESLADALTGPLNEDNKYTFDLCQKYVDDVILISEYEIGLAMAHGLLIEKQVLEGGGAAALAPLIGNGSEIFGENIVAVCSGNNVEMSMLLGLAALHKEKLM